MKLEMVISRTTCKTESFVDANPAFFNLELCKGCSLYHLCKMAAGNEAKIHGVD